MHIYSAQNEWPLLTRHILCDIIWARQGQNHLPFSTFPSGDLHPTYDAILVGAALVNEMVKVTGISRWSAARHANVLKTLQFTARLAITTLVGSGKGLADTAARVHARR